MAFQQKNTAFDKNHSFCDFLLFLIMKASASFSVCTPCASAESQYNLLTTLTAVMKEVLCVQRNHTSLQW